MGYRVRPLPYVPATINKLPYWLIVAKEREGMVTSPMYQRSFFIVVLALVLVAMANTGFRYLATVPWISGNPSAYDPNISIQEAFQSAKTPLLVEFYTDSCQTCRQVTPTIAKVKTGLADRLTFVMINLDDPQQQPVANIFGVSYVPALFVFDPGKMQKQQVPLTQMASEQQLNQALVAALDTLKTLPSRRRPGMMMPPTQAAMPAPAPASAPAPAQVLQAS